MFNFLKKKKKFTLALQQEVSECGLACLCMVLTYHGHQVLLEVLRQKHQHSARGVSVAELINIAEAYHLKSQVFLLRPRQLLTVQLPAILYVDTNHYVVLAKICKRKGYYILDPAYGKQWLSASQLKQRFNGIALQLVPTQQFMYVRKRTLPWVHYFKKLPNWQRHSSIILILSVSLQSLALLFPYVLQALLPIAKVSSNGFLCFTILGLMTCKLIESFLTVLRTMTISRIGNNAVIHVMARLLKKLFSLPLNYFSQRQAATIFANVNGVEIVRNLLSKGLLEAAIDSCLVIIILGMLLIISPWIFCLTLIISAIFLKLNFTICERAQDHNIAQVINKNKASFFLLQSLQGILSIKIFRCEARIIKKWLSLFSHYLSSTRYLLFYQSILDACRVFCLSIVIILFLFMDVQHYLLQQMSAVQFYILIFYINIYLKYITNITSKVFEVKEIILRSEQLHTIFLTPYANGVDRQQAATAPALSISKLSYRHSARHAWIVEDWTFTLSRGECLMFAGTSGSGKTSLFQVLMSLIPPCKGYVSVYGKIAAVMQEDVLFSGTIYENISFFAENIDKARIHEVTQLAELHETIAAMPMGYNTYVGEWGQTLSGGEKQRLLLARALYQQPDILFLDEAFSHVDSACENRLNVMLKRLKITRVIITHRQENLKFADHVFHLPQTMITDKAALTHFVECVT